MSSVALEYSSPLKTSEINATACAFLRRPAMDTLGYTDDTSFSMANDQQVAMIPHPEMTEAVSAQQPVFVPLAVVTQILVYEY
jgi:hypothetical protein